MKEFMLLIRNTGDAKATMSAEEHQQFLNGCMVYIEQLQKNGNFISAQPMVREGKMISGTPGAWKEGAYSEIAEIIVGYYHVRAKDLDEAIEIAKGNPEFAYTETAKIEVRPLKMKEETTSYVYPVGS